LIDLRNTKPLAYTISQFSKATQVEIKKRSNIIYTLSICSQNARIQNANKPDPSTILQTLCTNLEIYHKLKTHFAKPSHSSQKLKEQRIVKPIVYTIWLTHYMISIETKRRNPSTVML